ncbi:hypothetical protein CSV77_05340 [Sporosarcina sp. P16b]|nr:hypothetical protein CSV77_05340 [Sporosarcina sp. P16b]
MRKPVNCKCDKKNYCQNHCKKYCTRCRKDLCCPCFMIRLGGLQNGLNFRLRQMVCCEAEFQLNNDEIVKGTIVFVGSNFVEIFVNGKAEDLPTDSNRTDELKGMKRGHPIGETLLFPIDKISSVKTLGGCPSKNPTK